MPFLAMLCSLSIMTSKEYICFLCQGYIAYRGHRSCPTKWPQLLAPVLQRALQQSSPLPQGQKGQVNRDSLSQSALGIMYSL